MQTPIASKVRVLVAAVALGLPLAAHAAVWPMLGGSRAHLSASTFLGPQTSALAWSFPTKASIRGGAAVDVDGTVFFGNTKGTLFALEQGGTLRWSVAGLKRIVGVPALGSGRVYASSTAGTLYAFGTITGAPVWTFTAGSPLSTSPVVGSDGVVYFGTKDARLVAVAPDGTMLWQAMAGKIVDAAPAIGAGGTIFLGTVDGRIVALDPSGHVLFDTQIPHAKKLGTPVVHPAGRVYVGAKKGGLSAIDATTGSLVWMFAVPKPMGGLALGANGNVVFGAKDMKVYAVGDGGASPAVDWIQTIGGKISSTPAVDRDGAIFIGAEDRRVYAFEPQIGTIRWTFDAKKPFRSAIALGIGGRVLAGSDDKSLYAIGEPRSGEDCWSGAFTDTEGLTPAEAERQLQTLLAACGGPSVDSCRAIVQGSVNADRVAAANQIIAKEIDPATYLAILRDRTRKLSSIRRNGKLCTVAASDQDGDLVADPDDLCPDTPPLTPTTDDGCPDATRPEAPPADLVSRYLDRLHIVFDPNCGNTPPVTPIPFLLETRIPSVPPDQNFFLLFLDSPDAHPECGIFYEIEALVTKPNGTQQWIYAPFPRSRNIGITGANVYLEFRPEMPGPFGEWVLSGAFSTGYTTQMRARATTYRGARSPWSSWQYWDGYRRVGG